MAEVKVIKDGNNFFVEVDGVRIAQRDFPILRRPGLGSQSNPWEVVGSEDPDTIAIRCNRADVHPSRTFTSPIRKMR